MGTAYAGFQRQPEVMTVQQVLEEAVATVTGEQTRVLGSGRTDAGAHALGQVVAFDTSSSLSPQVLQRALNAHLPADIAVLDCEESSAEFHPRYDAVSRVYRYVFWNGSTRAPWWEGRAARVREKLDEVRMQEAALYLIGRHHFGAFVASAVSGSREREIFAARCWRDGDLVTLELEGSGFMKQMVRAIAGTLARVGAGRMTPDDFRAVLAGRDRRRAAGTAPAHGLYLVRVNYGPSSGACLSKE